MSVDEAERFANDLANDQTLLDEVKADASGLASIVTIGRKHGYNFSVDEAKEYIQTRSRHELTDQQLEAVAGGKGGSTATVTNSVQTAEVVTTAAEATQVATSAYGAAEGVAAAVGVIVIVLT